LARQRNAFLHGESEGHRSHTGKPTSQAPAFLPVILMAIFKAMALQKYLLLHSRHDELVRRISSSSSASSSMLSSPTRVSGSRGGDEEKLISVNNQTKAILIELLDCASEQDDPNFRVWVRSRLVETEEELNALSGVGHPARATPRGHS
jgi:hypothetical protein